MIKPILEAELLAWEFHTGFELVFWPKYSNVLIGVMNRINGKKELQVPQKENLSLNKCRFKKREIMPRLLLRNLKT